MILTQDTLRPSLPAGTPAEVRVLLAGLDSVYVSADLQVSDAVYEKLEREKEAARVAARAGQVHCPEWLGARMLPNGDKGGYAFLVETEDFTVKVCGRHTPNRPGLYVELRSHFLHIHAGGARGACEEALCWVREQLCYDLDEKLVHEAVCFERVKVSRADLHIDWQGGYAPCLEHVAGDLRCLIRPGKTNWGLCGAGTRPTGYTFGSGHIRARLYDKTAETATRNDESYAALLRARHGEEFDPAAGDVWRLEFQLRREGAKGFRLHAKPELDAEEGEAAQLEAEVEQELDAEELEHLGTLPRLFARMDELFRYLTWHWLRLVVEDAAQANRSRWPLHPTWAALREQFKEAARLGHEEPLDEDKRELVRGSRYGGKMRLLNRMALGVVHSLEVTDAATAPAALDALARWAERAAEREACKAEERRARYLEQYGRVPRWVECGMGARLERAEQVRHRVRMLLGIFAARGVLPLEHKPAYNVADLLEQHILDLEAEADAKGGEPQVLLEHFARVFRVPAPHDLFAPPRCAAAAKWRSGGVAEWRSGSGRPRHSATFGGTSSGHALNHGGAT